MELSTRMVIRGRQQNQGFIIDGLVKSHYLRITVIPANAGIQYIQWFLDAGSSPA